MIYFVLLFRIYMGLIDLFLRRKRTRSTKSIAKLVLTEFSKMPTLYDSKDKLTVSGIKRIYNIEYRSVKEDDLMYQFLMNLNKIETPKQYPPLTAYQVILSSQNGTREKAKELVIASESVFQLLGIKRIEVKNPFTHQFIEYDHAFWNELGYNNSCKELI
jgi:hypothetical protein